MRRWILVMLLIMIGLLFIPKENLYFSFENALKPYNIVINNEIISQHSEELLIENGQIVYEGIELGIVKTAEIHIFGFYNTASLNNFHPSDSFLPLFPGDIFNITIRHFPWNPKKLTFTGTGDIGKFSGSIDCSMKLIQIDILPTNQGRWLYRHWLKNMHEMKHGYHYESSYE